MGDDDRRRPSGPDGLRRAPKPVPSPWGDVIIPDDLSELAEEAAAVRRQLRSDRRRRLWSRRLGVADESGKPGMMGPLFIVVLAMVVALTSLFGGFLPYQDDTGRTAGPPLRGIGQPLPTLTLTDAAGTPVRLHQIRPAVILSVGRCACGNLIAETAALTHPGRVPLVVVGQPTAPTLPGTVEGGNPDAVRSLADPEGKLARAVAPSRPPQTGTATVVLVSRTGSIMQVLADVHSAQEFTAGVQRL